MRITANIATHPPRKKLLLATVNSLLDQVDQINICLNKYDEIPGWMNSEPKINAVIPKKDLKAGGKWSFLSEEEGIYLTCDDDIIYPSNYSSYMLDLINLTKGKVVVGFDGTMLTNKVITAKFPFNMGNARNRFVHLLGSGTIGAKVETVKKFKAKLRYSDIDFAKFCIEAGIPQLTPVKAPSWLRQQAGHFETSIQRGDSHIKRLRKVVESIDPFALHTASFPTRDQFGGWSISYELFLRLLREVPLGSKIVEFGSGFTTEILKEYYEVISVEHNPSYLYGDQPLAPLKNGWYDPKELVDIKTGVKAYIIDGPVGDRSGILRHLELLNEDATFFIDDTNREQDLRLAKKLGEILGRIMVEIKGYEKDYAIIEGNG